MALLRQLDFHGQELRLIDAELARVALGCENTKRLMTIPGVDVAVAMSITAAVGDFSRFSSPNKLVRYLGLNPRVKQSGDQPAAHGRIAKQGRAHARGMLVEAAWVAVKTPGPLRAFYERVRARRGMQIAVVATARKLAVLCWHMITRGEDYAFARPSLTAKKLRALELKAGHALPPRPEGHRRRLLAQGRPRPREGAGRTGRTRLSPRSSPTGRPRPQRTGTGVAAANGARLSRPSNGATAARQDTSPRSCASLGGRPRPPRRLTRPRDLRCRAALDIFHPSNRGECLPVSGKKPTQFGLDPARTAATAGGTRQLSPSLP